MLYMDVKIGGSILIGDTKVTLKEKSGQKARLAIDADKSIKVSHAQEDSRKEMAKGLTKLNF